MKRMVAVMFLAAFLLSEACLSTDMRCGQYLVRGGDTKVDVIRRCGEPYFRQLISGADERTVEQWYYIPARTQFQRIVTIRGTRVERIEIETR